MATSRFALARMIRKMTKGAMSKVTKKLIDDPVKGPMPPAVVSVVLGIVIAISLHFVIPQAIYFPPPPF